MLLKNKKQPLIQKDQDNDDDIITQIDLSQLTQSSTYDDFLISRGIIIINDDISKQSLTNASNQLLAHHFDKDFQDSIQIILNSPGGYVSAGHAFIDIMGFVKNPIRTIAIGQISSMATLIFIHGDERIMSSNCTAMIHQFAYKNAGNYSDLIAARKYEDLEMVRQLQMFINCSKYNTQEEVEKHLLKSHDNFLLPEEMLEHGLCDLIFQPKKYKYVQKKNKPTNNSRRKHKE